MFEKIKSPKLRIQVKKEKDQITKESFCSNRDCLFFLLLWNTILPVSFHEIVE